MAAEDDLKAALSREWFHSHEEDQRGEIVFRPAHFAFPPSRGRKSISLHPAGKLTGTIPGATDVPADVRGTWKLDNKNLLLEYGSTKLRYEIISATPDKLVLKRRD